ncbi:Inherit from COG: Methyltransferase [Seminavis robusta]|uniref:Inherit from COG: Methyltransferase n=1 Tax=Seminavis robusta TaxID=568900 RepID=A0A9N8H9B7_9STRA|nr:Inherit from COG: Methyltransferase [Seminavis robusta]|eukprot:Sro113_g055920.1 Inherit from COG: Methyltransferase (325) ;mRNA; f:10388-11362
MCYYQYHGRGDLVKTPGSNDLKNKNSLLLEQHEHVLDCADAVATMDDPGVNVPLHSSCVAPAFDMNVHSGNDLISKRIRTWGCFECAILNKFMQFMAAQTPSDTFFLDIGANIGMYSLHAAALGRDVFSFEPFQRNYQRLCKSISMNQGFEERIVVFNVALMDHPTTVDFGKVSNKNYGGVGVNPEDDSQDKESSSSTPVRGLDYAPGVPLSSLETILPVNRPAVIKINVEGSECRVLGGAIDYLNTLDILYVEIEWSPSMKTCEHTEEIFKLFQKNGLSPYQYHYIQDVWKPINVTEWLQWHNHWFIENVLKYSLIDIAWIRE